MTRNRTSALTAFSAALLTYLSWGVADRQFSGNWWNAQTIVDSTIFTYLLLAAIVGAGALQAHRLPAAVALVPTEAK